MTNKTVLAPGGYYLNVTVTDNEGNSLSETFIVAVLPSTTTTTTTSTTTTTTGTNTTTTQTIPIDGLSWMIPVLVGMIVILAVFIVIQSRKS